MRPDEYKPEADFASLLALVTDAVESQGGLPIPEGMGWLNDRQTLAKKLVLHLHSVQRIREGLTVRVGDGEVPFVDHGSITVLARAILENVIVFAFVFGHSDMETCHFRHMSWQLGGLMDRQRRQAITVAGKRTQEAEARQVAELVLSVEASPRFRALSNGAQKAIVRKGDWKTGLSWQELAVDAGLNSRYFRLVYSYLCDYSHTSYAAVLQVGQADSVDVQTSMAQSMLGIMNLAMARFAGIYMDLFPQTRALASRAESKAAFDRWWITPERMEQTYGSEP